MPRCPLCSDRSAKRFCPAKAATICTVCCGTKREVEIDCPASCPHLHAGRAYEAERKTLNPELQAQIGRFNEQFLTRYAFAADAVLRSVMDERSGNSAIVDADVLDVYKALQATMRTLSSGIYYETLPSDPGRIPLFRKLRTTLDLLMQPNPERPTLKVSEVLALLDFLALYAEMYSNSRPRSRQYLDWLATAMGVSDVAASTGRILVP